MAKISMDPEQAIACGNQIVQNASSYNTEIKKIYSIVGDLKTTWTGSAVGYFKVAFLRSLLNLVVCR